MRCYNFRNVHIKNGLMCMQLFYYLILYYIVSTKIEFIIHILEIFANPHYRADLHKQSNTE